MDLSTLGLGKNRVSVPIENMRMIAHHLPGKKRMITLLCMMERAIQEKNDRTQCNREERRNDYSTMHDGEGYGCGSALMAMHALFCFIFFVDMEIIPGQSSLTFLECLDQSWLHLVIFNGM